MILADHTLRRYFANGWPKRGESGHHRRRSRQQCCAWRHLANVQGKHSKHKAKAVTFKFCYRLDSFYAVDYYYLMIYFHISLGSLIKDNYV